MKANLSLHPSPPSILLARRLMFVPPPDWHNLSSIKPRNGAQPVPRKRSSPMKDRYDRPHWQSSRNPLTKIIGRCQTDGEKIAKQPLRTFFKTFTKDLINNVSEKGR